MKYVDDSIKLSPHRQFCCPLSFISTSSSANPVSPRFFFGFDMLTFTARHFEKTLVASSTQLTGKPPKATLKPLGRPSFPGYGYGEPVRTLHNGLPTVAVQRIKKLQFKLGSVGGLENAFCSYQLKTNLKNNSDCPFGPTNGQWHKSPSNDPSASYPEGL